jgi:hypothetical protein
MMAPVRFDAFVDPNQRLLVGETAVGRILRSAQIRAQASGDPIDDEQSAALEELLSASPPIEMVGGGEWTEAELQAIVADYFSMLDDELAGRRYSKTEHRNALLAGLHRTPGSIERKHQNISAVLHELGFRWINGYKPLRNFQDALVDAVEARIDRAIDRVDQTSIRHVERPIDAATIFVPPPPPSSGTLRGSIGRVSRKYDLAARDAANRTLGRAGEDFVFQIERARLEKLGRCGLAEQVNWVSDQVGDGLGYDISSFDEYGNPVFIEVKTTCGPITTPFFISENERRVAAQKGPAYRIYRVFGFGTDPKIYELLGPLETTLALEPVAYRARVRAPASRLERRGRVRARIGG